MLAGKFADLNLFWTAFDPLDLASGSIDVLGFQPGYISLANKLFPGFTTVTVSPRYVSMLSAAVSEAEKVFPGTGGTDQKQKQKRITAVKSYERAWALACGLAAGNGVIGEKAVEGLRGIQYVRRRMSEFSQKEKSISTGSINLLSNQVRYGGIGAYSTFMEDCHLVQMRSVSTRPLGARLAEAFPRPERELRLWDEERPLPIDALREWGTKCHLGDFTAEEGRRLVEALRGGEEREWDDDVRWSALRILAQVGQDVISETDILSQMLVVSRDGASDRLKVHQSCVRQIEATLVLVHPYERFYQGIQFLFEAIRAEATDQPVVPIADVARAKACQRAAKGLRLAAQDLLRAIEEAGKIHSQTVQDCARVFESAGVTGMAKAMLANSDEGELIEMIIQRHSDVQGGKFDRGDRKATWIKMDSLGKTFRLTAQRHQLDKSGRYTDWEQIPWHPYRTIGARRFIHACRIR